MEFDAQTFFDEHCVFTDDKQDFVLLKNLYDLLETKPSWKEFKRKMLRVKVNNTFMCYDVKYIDGKSYCNVYWKVSMRNAPTKDCIHCQGTGEMYLCDDCYSDCFCVGGP